MTMTAGAESANIVRKMACLKNVMVLGLCDELTLNLSVAIPLRVGEVKERVRQRTVRPVNSAVCDNVYWVSFYCVVC